MKVLLEDKIVQYTDTLLQDVEGQYCVVKNSQVRDTNYWYEVPPIVEKELKVPSYYLEQPHRPEDNRPPSS